MNQLIPKPYQQTRFNVLMIWLMILVYINCVRASTGKSGNITICTVTETEDSLKDRLFANYRKSVRPLPDHNHHLPTVVAVNIFISSFGNIDVMAMEYSIDILLRQYWQDDRLRYTGCDFSVSLNDLREKSLWIPDLFFRNSRYGYRHEISTPNYLIWLDPNGAITYSQKVSLRLACPMKLKKFPMDTQICYLDIGSYGYKITDLRFVWRFMENSTQNVEINSDMMLNEFELPSIRTYSCEKNFSATGNFACLKAEFVLNRQFGFYLINSYAPSLLIVTISWMSFFINSAAVPARISLGLLSVLSLMTQTSSTMQKLPRVSYVKAMDIWLFFCLAFVVFSMLEYMFVYAMTRKQSKRSRKISEEDVEDGNAGTSSCNQAEIMMPFVKRANLKRRKEDSSNEPSEKSALYKMMVKMKRIKKIDINMKARRIDRICVFAYPLAFFVFNLCYWIYYLFIASD